MKKTFAPGKKTQNCAGPSQGHRVHIRVSRKIKEVTRDAQFKNFIASQSTGKYILQFENHYVRFMIETLCCRRWQFHLPPQKK